MKFNIVVKTKILESQGFSCQSLIQSITNYQVPIISAVLRYSDDLHFHGACTLEEESDQTK